MDRGEPTLAPQWLKPAGSSSYSDEQNTGSLSRNRLAVSVCDHHAPRVSSSSFWRSVRYNGSIRHDKDSFAQTRGYSSFCRSHRDRDRDRQRNRDKDNLLDNGYYDYSDSLMTQRPEKGTLRRSQSMIPGQRCESLPKRPGSVSSNKILSMGSLSGGFSKVSFERDFPSLRAEEKHGVPPGISTAINNLPISTSAIMGADGWTSALVEVPAAGLGNGYTMSFSLQTTSSMASTGSSTTAGLRMAEALAQAPSWGIAPSLSNEDEKRKELTLMQYNKLIPVVNSSENSKAKGARNGELVAPKVVQHVSSQLVNHGQCLPATKSDILKTSQAGNFLVLNREKNVNGTSTTLKGPPVTMVSKVATSLGNVPSASIPQLKPSPANVKINVNGIVGEKKPVLSQDRNNFFNSLRKQAEKKICVLHHHPDSKVSSATSSRSSVSSVSNSVMKSDEQILGVSSASGLEPSVAEDGNDNVCNEEPETFVAPDEEEKAFLESLGWSENSGEDALTAEEIKSFVKKHEEKLAPVFKHKGGLPESWRDGSESWRDGSLDWSSSESET